MSGLCLICQLAVSKYKCPTCTSPYCSLDCFKSHKATPCSPPLPAIIEDRTPSDERVFQTPDTVPLETLKRLGESGELRDLLQNPHLRDFLRKIDSAANPAGLMRKAMREPLFVEFVDECLRVVEPQPADLTDEQVLAAITERLKDAEDD